MHVQSGRRLSMQSSTDDDLLHAVVSGQTHQALALLAWPSLSESAVNFRDPDGWTPLFYACSRGEVRLAKELLKRGASVNAAAENDGNTALHVCASAKPSEAGHDDFLSTASAVMSEGGNPYQNNAAGQTPIHVAARSGNKEMKMLLESCALYCGILGIRTPRLFGEKLSERMCFLQPRYGWGGKGGSENESMVAGCPNFELVLYKDKTDAEPRTVISLPSSPDTELRMQDPKSGDALLVSVGQSKSYKSPLTKPKIGGVRIGLRAPKNAAMTSKENLELLSVIFSCIAEGRRAEGLGFLCKAGYSWAMRRLELPQGLVELPQENVPAVQTSFPDRSTSNPSSPAGTPDKKAGRRSLSLSRIGKAGKAAMRRMSFGGEPKRDSLSQEDTPGRRSKTFSRIWNTETYRISEETPEDPLAAPAVKPVKSRMFSTRTSRTFDRVKEKLSRRLSLHGSRPSMDVQQPAPSQSLSERKSALQAQMELIHSLPTTGNTMMLWKRIYAELKKIADESAAGVSGNESLGHFEGQLDSSWLSGEATWRDRSSVDITHSDMEMRDVSNRGGVPKGSPRPMELEAVKSQDLDESAVNESSITHPPHVLQPLSEGELGGRFQPEASVAQLAREKSAQMQTQASRNSSGNLSIEGMQGLSNLGMSPIILDTDNPELLRQTPPDENPSPQRSLDNKPTHGDFPTEAGIGPITPGQTAPSNPYSASEETPTHSRTDSSGPPKVSKLTPRVSGANAILDSDRGSLRSSSRGTPRSTATPKISPFAQASAVVRANSEETPPTPQSLETPLHGASPQQYSANHGVPASQPEGPIPGDKLGKTDPGTSPGAQHLKEIIDLRQEEIEAITGMGTDPSRGNLHQGAHEATGEAPGSSLTPPAGRGDSMEVPATIYDTQISAVETFLDTVDHISVVPRHINAQGTPNDSLMKFLKQQGERPGNSAPRPITRTKFSNDSMFGSEIESADDLFVWSQRPRRPANAFNAAKLKQGNVSELTAKAAQLLEADRKMIEAALENLQDTAELSENCQAVQNHAVQDGIVKPKLLRQPSGEAIPQL